MQRGGGNQRRVERIKDKRKEGRRNKGTLTLHATLCKRESCREYIRLLFLGHGVEGRRGGKMGEGVETSVGRDPIKWRLINSRAQKRVCIDRLA